MKRFAALAAVAVLTFAAWTATAVPESNSDQKPSRPEARCLLPAFEVFSAKVWAPKHWERGEPPRSTIEAAHRRFGCAPTKSHRKAMKHTWKADRHRFYARRSTMLWRTRVTPFYYGGHWWAVPYPIALCESGGDYYVGPSGAYGLIPPFPQWLSPREQDEIAHRLYLEQGEGPWAPYEGGCAYR